MRFILDSIIAIVFWSFTAYSTVEVYRFFREASVAKIERGLNSTARFTEELIAN